MARPLAGLGLVRGQASRDLCDVEEEGREAEEGARARAEQNQSARPPLPPPSLLRRMQKPLSSNGWSCSRSTPSPSSALHIRTRIEFKLYESPVKSPPGVHSLRKYVDGKPNEEREGRAGGGDLQIATVKCRRRRR